MTIVTIVGARPQFIKAAPVCHELKQRGLKEIFVHTGQHYDSRMSANFFAELDLPQPDYNLGVGSGPHGVQTGRMLEALEEILLQEKPDCVLVYGDTNSTLAGALAAAKLHLPIAHVEAGIRSYNPVMPEEINRRLTDHVSNALLCPTSQAVRNLKIEGFSDIVGQGELVDSNSLNELKITKGSTVLNVGDVMYDMLVKALPYIDKLSPKCLDKYQVSKGGYVLTTIHRPENTDYEGHLAGIVKGLSALPFTVIWPAHPRTELWLTKFNLLSIVKSASNIVFTEPVGYLELLCLCKNALCAITDSGGIQKEAYMLGIPCLTCRNETEWPETVKSGWNHLIGLGAKELEQSFPFRPPKKRPQWFGDGNATGRIVEVLLTLQQH